LALRASRHRHREAGTLPWAFLIDHHASFHALLKAYLFHIWCVDKQKDCRPPPGAVVAFFMILASSTKLSTYLLTYWRGERVQ